MENLQDEGESAPPAHPRPRDEYIARGNTVRIRVDGGGGGGGRALERRRRLKSSHIPLDFAGLHPGAARSFPFRACTSCSSAARRRFREPGVFTPARARVLRFDGMADRPAGKSAFNCSISSDKLSWCARAGGSRSGTNGARRVALRGTRGNRASFLCCWAIAGLRGNIATLRRFGRSVRIRVLCSRAET